MSTSDLTVDPDLVALADSVFSGTPHRLGEIDRDLWAQLASLGLTRLTDDEERGGSGAGWLESAAVLAAAARHGVSVPLVEHDLLAGWLARVAGLAALDGISTACVLDEQHSASGVGWASVADQIVVLWSDDEHWFVGVAGPQSCQITPSHNLAGEFRDRVVVDPAAIDGREVRANIVTQFFLRGALARAVQTVAALRAAVDLSVEYATTRTQFGRSLSQFQAIQHMLADAAAESWLAQAAVDSAVARVAAAGWDDPQTAHRVAVARSCAAQAVSVVVRVAHQVHGAIGTTAEHRLHTLTLPVMAWRSEFGTTHDWEQAVTDAVTVADGPTVWEFVVG